MLGRVNFPRIGDLPYLVTLPPFGFFWFKFEQGGRGCRATHFAARSVDLVLGHGWDKLISAAGRLRTFETDVLPGYHAVRRWFADKGSRNIHDQRSLPRILMENGTDRFLAVIASVDGTHGTSRYFLPLTVRWARYTDVDRGPASVLAAVRRGPRRAPCSMRRASRSSSRRCSPRFTTARPAAPMAISSNSARPPLLPSQPMPEIKTVKAIDARAVEQQRHRQQRLRYQDLCAAFSPALIQRSRLAVS